MIRYGRFTCTLARGLAAGLPASLEALAEALDLPHKKDKAGARRMLLMARPRRARKGEDPSAVHYHDSPEHRRQLDEYALQDCRATAEAHLRLPALPSKERELELLTHTINERGFQVDVGLARAICEIGRSAAAEIDAKLAKLTRGEVTASTQTARIFKLAKAWSYKGQSLDQDAVERQLAKQDLDPKLRRLLLLRVQGAGAAIKKFNALLSRVSPDGRIRHWAQYHGAATGRFSGKGYQPQNLRRLTLSVEEIKAAIAAITAGSLERVKKIHANPLELMGEMGRPAIIAASGHVLMGADLSAIESRCLAWIADERWKLDSYRRFDATHDPRDEPYCETACRIFGKPSGTFTKASPERKIGKIADLAFGYAGALGAWRNFAPEGHTDEEVEAFKRDWRAAHPATVKLWRLINHSTLLAVENPGDTVVCGRLQLECDGAFLCIKLPSGRRISYPRPSIIKGTYGPCVSFHDNSAGQFKPCRNGQGGYGGLWTENIVQGIARDVLAEAMLRIEAAGYPLVLHVHDEVVCEVRIGFGSLKTLLFLLTIKPRWALDLPLAAEAWQGSRYVKS
jgi:DNA polymerase bacteriophage-type